MEELNKKSEETSGEELIVNDLQASNQNNDKNIVKEAYEQKQKGYNLKDAVKGFFFGGYVAPILAVLIVATLIAIIMAITNQDYNSVVNAKPVLILTLLSTEVGFVGYFLYSFLSKRNKKKFKDVVGFTFKKIDLFVCLLLVILAVVMSLLTSNFINVCNTGLHGIGVQTSSELPFQIDSIGNLILGLVFLALVPAVCEEFLFRGVVLGGLLNSTTGKKAKVLCVVLSAFIFALIHQSAIQFVYPFVMGLVFGFIYLYTRNLVYSMIAHFTGNAFVVIVNYYYAVNNIGEPSISYNFSYVLGSIALFLLALVLAFGVIYAIKKIMKNKSPFVVDDSEVDKYEAEVLLETLSTKDAEVVAKEVNINKTKKKIENAISSKYLLLTLVFGTLLFVFEIVYPLIK